MQRQIEIARHPAIAGLVPEDRDNDRARHPCLSLDPGQLIAVLGKERILKLMTDSGFSSAAELVFFRTDLPTRFMGADDLCFSPVAAGEVQSVMGTAGAALALGETRLYCAGTLAAEAKLKIRMKKSFVNERK